ISAPEASLRSAEFPHTPFVRLQSLPQAPMASLARWQSTLGHLRTLPGRRTLQPLVTAAGAYAAASHRRVLISHRAGCCWFPLTLMLLRPFASASRFWLPAVAHIHGHPLCVLLPTVTGVHRHR